MPARFQQLFNAISQIVSVDPQASSGDLEGLPPLSELSFEQELRSDMWQNAANDLPPLSEQATALLQQQTITATEPGTILQDFQTMLELIGNQGVPVSSTNHLFSQKLLTDLNQRLNEPVQLDLKRPVQKSYPPIDGLYLLRTSGLGQIISKGKKYFLILNSELLRTWNCLIFQNGNLRQPWCSMSFGRVCTASKYHWAKSGSAWLFPVNKACLI